MAYYTNNGVATAEYEGMAVRAESKVTVQIPAITLLKTTDTNMWTGDELTYNVKVANTEDPGSTATNVVFTDTIDITKAALNTDSVIINGTPAVLGTDFTYDPATGLLTIPLDDLDPSDEHEISFRIKKVLP